MVIVRFGIHVTSYASKLTIIIRVCVAFLTLIPFSLMLATIYWKILIIMVKCRRSPSIFIVTTCTICWKLQCYVIWICGGLIITIMAAYTCIWCIIIISIVTFYTIICYCSMRTIQWIYILMCREKRRAPTRIGRMTSDTIRSKVQLYVIWVGSLVEIIGMTTYTRTRCSFKSIGMTLHTIGAIMCSGQWEHRRIVVKNQICVARRMTCQTCGTII